MKTLKLTDAELRALAAMTGEGYQSLMSDDGTISAYLGGKRGAAAAERALMKIQAAVGHRIISCEHPGAIVDRLGTTYCPKCDEVIG